MSSGVIIFFLIQNHTCKEQERPLGYEALSSWLIYPEVARLYQEIRALEKVDKPYEQY